MKRKHIFIFIATLLFFPWTIAYAYDGASASTGQIVISPVDEANLPQFNVYGGAIGSVTPGDIFLIDSAGSYTDASFSLSLTNTDDLVHNFRYMTLQIGIYIENADAGWEKASDQNAIYLTMQNGAVSFSLAGGAVYRITIDKGCYACYGSNNTKTVALPGFYLTTN